MNIRASYWTWKLINGERIPDEMSTAYIMLDGKCMYDCAYCTHARNSRSDSSYLSRIVWKEIALPNLLEKIALFKRICVQTVNYKGYDKDILTLVKQIKGAYKEILISVSTRVSGTKEIDTYIENGVDQLGIALDCVNKELHKAYRGKQLEYTLSLIEYGAKKYPGKITTHIIVGLGEKDIELVETFRRMKRLNVEVALFAFTPVKGTKLQNSSPPDLDRYRKIQILRYIIFEKNQEPIVEFDENGYIQKFIYEAENVQFAFLTSGCKHCTRPYYNDRPIQKLLYNYHKLPSTSVQHL